MANTALSDVATSVSLSVGGETRVPALGDGTAKPGDVVGIVGATGKVVQASAGSSELFVGFLDINVETDMDTAIVDGVPCEIIVPKSGRTYACRIENPSGTEYEGQPYYISDTAGALEAAATLNTAGVNSVLAGTTTTGDLYGKIRWL